jgi:hypothetical protein
VVHVQVDARAVLVAQAHVLAVQVVAEHALDVLELVMDHVPGVLHAQERVREIVIMRVRQRTLLQRLQIWEQILSTKEALQAMILHRCLLV